MLDIKTTPVFLKCSEAGPAEYDLVAPEAKFVNCAARVHPVSLSPDTPVNVIISLSIHSWMEPKHPTMPSLTLLK